MYTKNPKHIHTQYSMEPCTWDSMVSWLPQIHVLINSDLHQHLVKHGLKQWPPQSFKGKSDAL
jgi:hypothetical protein